MWNNIVNLGALNFTSSEMGDSYKIEAAPLGKKMGAKKLGFNAKILPPGKFSCPFHFHHSEEELFLVLEGKAMLRQSDQFREVSQGDLIFCTTGPAGSHQFYNHTDQPFRYFALSTKDEFDVVEYPDSNKVSVLKLMKTFQTGTEVDYFTGEMDPKGFWPKEHLHENL